MCDAPLHCPCCCCVFAKVEKRSSIAGQHGVMFTQCYHHASHLMLRPAPRGLEKKYFTRHSIFFISHSGRGGGTGDRPRPGNSIVNPCETVVPQQVIFFSDLGVETHRGGVAWRHHTLGGQQRKVISECPRGARKALKDCNDN